MATVAQEVLNSKENYTEKYGFSMPESYVYKADKGLSEEVVRKISDIKNEPQWMKDFRIRSLKIFFSKPMPKWGANLTGIDFDAITYYLKATDTKSTSWDDVPENIKKTFDRLGIPEAEKKFLAGAGAQYDSEVIYHQIREDLEKQGVIFLSMDSGLKEHEDLVKKYFGTVIPPEDNKFAALNSAVWSGGSFVFVPKGVHVEMPLQAYFRINAKNMGQFERTLIVAEPGSSIHYIEGCFVKGTSVKTSSGEKKIEDIKENDVVPTHTGKHKRVYKTMKRKHSGTLCTIRYSNNSDHELKVTGGHPILAVEKETVSQKNWKPKWIEAGQLDNFDYIAMPIREFSKMGDQLSLSLSTTDLMLQQKIILYANKNCCYAFVPIKSIEKEIVQDLDVYNFSVEEDESYVANGIIVHNCTAPSYSSDSLHSAVVELIAMEGSKIQYTTIQNWSNNVYNLVTKRAFAYKNAEVFWVDGNLGSKVTMKFPAVWLLGEGARGEVLSVAFAGAGQHQDAGAKILHFAPNTSSVITNKSISKDGGKTTYRGLVKVAKGATNAKSTVVCDALILDEKSSSDTVPYMELEEKDIQISHEATVGKINEDQLFYLMSRGMSEREAMAMIVRGFIERFTKTLPMEYAIELNRLIELEMEGSVG